MEYWFYKLESWLVNFHSSIFSVLIKKKTYRNIRKYLKSLGCSKSEQNLIISSLKKRGYSFDNGVINCKVNYPMKEKYFAFDGTSLNFVGEYESINDALDDMDEKESVSFYVTSAKEWEKIAKNMQIELQKHN